MSIQEHFSDIADDLEEILELDELSAQLYLNLLRTGPITASALAKELGLDRARTYRTIDRLMSKGLISTTLSTPKLCIAVNPQEALKLALGKKQDEVNKLVKFGDDIVSRINEKINTSFNNKMPTFRIVQGRPNTYSDIANVIEESETIVYIVTTAEDAIRMYHSYIPEKIIEFQKRGGQVRLIVELENENNLQYVKRMQATETRINKLPSKSRMVVSESKKVMMSDSTIITNDGNFDFTLITDSQELTKINFSLCEYLWHDAKKLKN